MIIVNFVDLVKFMLEHWTNYVSVLAIVAIMWFLLMTTASFLIDKIMQGVIGIIIVLKNEQNDKK